MKYLAFAIALALSGCGANFAISPEQARAGATILGGVIQFVVEPAK